MNYLTYRNMASRQDRKDYQKEYYREISRIKQNSTPLNITQQSSAGSIHTDTDTDTKIKHNVKAIASDDILLVLNFLNEKTGKGFQLKNPKGGFTANAIKIKDRLKDGYTVQQCKTVIARKINDWKDWDGSRNALNPITIFRKSNFEKYIGECVVDE